MEKRELPVGWRWKKLIEVCHVVNGTTPMSSINEYWGGDIVWITPTDLGRLQKAEILDSERHITQKGFDSCGLELVPEGTVILSSRAPIGHLGIASVPLCTNQGCKSLVPREKIDSKFLYFALKYMIPELQRLGSGTTFAEVSKSQVENFEIPLSSLPEQKRIAAILTDQLAAVERVRKAAEEQLKAITELPAALLHQAFTGNL